MGDAPAVDTPLSDLRDEVRRRMGHQADGLADACDEVVTTACRWWPQRHMATLARRKVEARPDTVHAVTIIEAKCREDLEARFGVDGNTMRTLDLLVPAVVVEMAAIWFSDVEARIHMRRAMWVARNN